MKSKLLGSSKSFVRAGLVSVSLTVDHWPIPKQGPDKRRAGSSTGCPVAQDLNLLAARVPRLPITQFIGPSENVDGQGAMLAEGLQGRIGAAASRCSPPGMPNACAGTRRCPWQQPAGIALHDGLKWLDVERRLNQFQDGRFHWEVWGMGTEDDPIDGHARRGQSRDRADHSTHCAISFESRNIHDRVGLRQRRCEPLSVPRMADGRGAKQRPRPG